MRTEISAVLPVFDESRVIEEVVRHTHAALARLCRRWELIAVDDGSRDGSGALLERLAGDLQGVRVIHFDRNRGYGHALRAGFAVCSLERVFFMDSDGQFDANDLERLLAEDADLVIGHRIGRTDGPLRIALSNGYNWLVRRSLGVHARDVNCAFKLIRREALLALDLREGGYLLNAELLAKAERTGLQVREVGIPHHPRVQGASKIGPADVPRALSRLLALRVASRRWRA